MAVKQFCNIKLNVYKKCTRRNTEWRKQMETKWLLITIPYIGISRVVKLVMQSFDKIEWRRVDNVHF